MARDPWRKAYLLSRSRSAGGPPSAGAPPPGFKRRPRYCCWLTGLALLILLPAAAALWFNRARWLPRYREQLPAPVQQALPLPQIEVDVAALDSGLGARLVMFGDYLDFVAATREWGSGWQLSSSAGEQRLEADGVRVYIRGGRIYTYELDVARLFAQPAWKPWRPALQSAWLTPELTYEAATGGQPSAAAGDKQEMRLSGNLSARLREGPARAVYILRFKNGRLATVTGAVELESDPAVKL